MKKVVNSPTLAKAIALILCFIFLTACQSGDISSTSPEQSGEISDESSSISDESFASEESKNESSFENESKDESTSSNESKDESTSVDESKEEQSFPNESEDESTTSEASSEEPKEDFNTTILTGTYKGVADHHNLTSAQKDTFKYTFVISGKTQIFSLKDPQKDNYALQNILKRGYDYKIHVDKDDKTIVSVEEIVKPVTEFTPAVSGVHGEKTLENFLKTSLMPTGTALYIYGGGWNWQDNGSSVQATTLGVSDTWVKFFDSQDTNFTYRNNANKANSYFPHGGWNEYYFAGLDCSGFVGWAVYNTLNTENGKNGYVISATKFAKNLASMGYGTKQQYSGSTAEDFKGVFKPGDIVSKNGHVYIIIGGCDDGSYVILHSTPSNSRDGAPGGGVQLSSLGANENCKAYELADYYMKTYYPKWYSRYTAINRTYSDLVTFTTADAGVFSWNVEGENKFLDDTKGIKNMSAEQVLEILFKDAKK